MSSGSATNCSLSQLRQSKCAGPSIARTELLHSSFSAVVPKVELSADMLDFSRCFLRHGYDKTIKLINASDLPVKYEIMKQSEKTQELIVWSPLSKVNLSA